ncbi:ribokinase [Oscillospiraceae bacterium MB08-C2-2]|nr:ribokinase [Oscillospiraceae bacterium MB08-C2-2]
MKSILNFGSLNLDHVYSVEHFVKPGETLASLGYQVFPGGKGLNQSIALSLAGGQTFHAGKVGADGLWLVDLLAEKGVDTRFVETDGQHTGHAMIQVNSKGQNCILLYGGANAEISEAAIEKTLSHFSAGDLLVLQNEINGLPFLMEKAYEKGMEIALNPSPITSELLNYPLEKVTWFLLNELEGQTLSGKSLPNEICEALLKKYPQSRIVLTLGKEGVLYRDSQQSFTHGIYDVPVVDTTAAGDTFTGFLLASAAQGASIPRALELASIASSLAVSQKGAAVSIPTIQQVTASSLQLL